MLRAIIGANQVRDSPTCVEAHAQRIIPRMTPRILIVDDDPAQRRILEEMCKRFGFDPVTADGGEAGLAFLTGPRGSAVDLVVLDLVMPGMDGMEFLERLSAVRSERPVIVQTAQGSIET